MVQLMSFYSLYSSSPLLSNSTKSVKAGLIKRDINIRRGKDESPLKVKDGSPLHSKDESPLKSKKRKKLNSKDSSELQSDDARPFKIKDVSQLQSNDDSPIKSQDVSPLKAQDPKTGKKKVVIEMMNSDVYENVVSRISSIIVRDIRLKDLHSIWDFKETGVTRNDAQKQLDKSVIERLNKRGSYKPLIREIRYDVDTVLKGFANSPGSSPYIKHPILNSIFCDTYLKMLGRGNRLNGMDYINNYILVKIKEFDEFKG